MKCMFCEKLATVHLTDIVNKKKSEAHLCEKCARERNLLPEQPGPQINLKALLKLMKSPQLSQHGSAVAPGEGPCPACGLTYAAFKAEGRFGCAHDYDAFHAILEPLLERVHRATTHTGKIPSAARELARIAELDDLRSQMKAAIENEDYEQAARLRDLLRKMEAEGTPG
jgi:protein arginine kinase activator